MRGIERRLARLEMEADRSWSGGPLQLICIHGGLPTDSGEIEAHILGADIALVREPDEDLEDFKQRAATEARLVGARHVVVRGLPSRHAAEPHGIGPP
jgi:hypothetical protein